MNTRGSNLQDVIDRLQAQGLMPPVKVVESGAGGWVRVTVVGSADQALRTRLAAAMGPTRWKLIEAQNEADAGTEYR